MGGVKIEFPFMSELSLVEATAAWARAASRFLTCFLTSDTAPLENLSLFGLKENAARILTSGGLEATVATLQLDF